MLFQLWNTIHLDHPPTILNDHLAGEEEVIIIRVKGTIKIIVGVVILIVKVIMAIKTINNHSTDKNIVHLQLTLSTTKMVHNFSEAGEIIAEEVVEDLVEDLVEDEVVDNCKLNGMVETTTGTRIKEDNFLQTVSAVHPAHCTSMVFLEMWKFQSYWIQGLLSPS